MLQTKHALGTAEYLNLDDVADVFGLPNAAVPGLIASGLLVGDGETIPMRSVDRLAERLLRSAIPVYSDATGVSLAEAIRRLDADPDIWSKVLAAILSGRIKVFRPIIARPGRVLDMFLLSSDRVIAEICPGSRVRRNDPFIWTPAASC